MKPKSQKASLQNGPKQSREEQKKLRRTEKQEKAEFLKKVRNAPNEKAPLTTRTRGYYRFAKKYPNNVDEQGFRVNEKRRRSGKTRQTVIAVVACTIAFFAGLLLTKTALTVSKTEPPAKDEPVDTLEDLYMIMPEEALSDSDITDGYINGLKKDGVNCIVLGYKLPDGTLPYSSKSKSLNQIMAKLKSSGISTAAYISTLKDTKYATDNPSCAVMRSTQEETTVLRNKDGFAFLNPFSEDAISYVSGVISSAASSGFDYIILDDISLAVNTGDVVANYPGYNGMVGEVNKALTNAFTAFRKASGDAEVILVTDVYGFYNPENPAGTRYEGVFNPPFCQLRAVDLRIGTQNTTGKDPLGLYSYTDTVPSVFVLEAAAEALRDAAQGTRLFALCTDAQSAGYARSCGIRDIIIIPDKK